MLPVNEPSRCQGLSSNYLTESQEGISVKDSIFPVFPPPNIYFESKEKNPDYLAKASRLLLETVGMVWCFANSLLRERESYLIVCHSSLTAGLGYACTARVLGSC